MATSVSWRSDSDMPLRKAVIEQIRLFFEQRQSQQPLQKGFPDFVKRLELVLYKSASSKEEYCNPSTLLDRLKSVAKHLQSQRTPYASPCNLDAVLSRDPPGGPCKENSFRPGCGLSSTVSGADLFPGLQDEAAFLDFSSRPPHGFLGSADVSQQVPHHHPKHPGEKNAGWLKLLHPESQTLMSSDISEDGFISAIESWSTSGTSSAAATQVSDSTLWLGDTSNPYYSDDVDLGTDFQLDKQSGGSLDALGRTHQALDGAGFAQAAPLGNGHLCSQVTALPRRRSCPAEYGVGGINVSSRVDERKFMGASNPAQQWNEDNTIWDPTAGTQGPLAAHQDVGQQAFASLGMSAPSLVGYNDRLHSAAAQSNHPGVMSGVNDRSGGMLPVQLSPGRAPADMGLVHHLEPSAAGSLFARQLTGVTELKRVVQGPGLDMPDSRMGISPQGEQFTQSDGSRLNYLLRSMADANMHEAKKAPLLGNIPENSVAIGDIPVVGLRPSDLQPSRQIPNKSMVLSHPSFSVGVSGVAGDLQSWALSTRGPDEERKVPEDVKDSSSQMPVRDELAHAYKCQKLQCSLMCHQFRRVFAHAKSCSVRKPACADCRWLGMLLSVHRKNCSEPGCPLPCCR